MRLARRMEHGRTALVAGGTGVRVRARTMRGGRERAAGHAGAVRGRLVLRDAAHRVAAEAHAADGVAGVLGRALPHVLVLAELVVVARARGRAAAVRGGRGRRRARGGERGAEARGEPEECARGGRERVRVRRGGVERAVGRGVVAEVATHVRVHVEPPAASWERALEG